MLSRISYRKVVKGLDHYRKQHEEDRRENPNAIPLGWGSSLTMMIESVVRGNHEPCSHELADQVLRYLVEKKLLVHYAGDYTFPTDEQLPTEYEIRKRVADHFIP